MSVDDAVDILRDNGFNIVLTYEEYFIITKNGLSMISEEELIKSATKILVSQQKLNRVKK